MENHATRLEIVEALAKGRGESSRYSETIKARLLYAAKPFRRGDEIVGVVRMAIPLTQIDEAVAALKVYDLGKPLVVEEFFPLHCSQDEAIAFVKAAQPVTDGWISFYWGVTIDEYDRRDGISAGILAEWLRWFQSQSPSKR